MTKPVLRAAVMGWPVEHSLSPRLHGFWLKKYGIAGSYEALAVPPEKLERDLRDLPKQGFRGANLTIPHKEAASRLVDRLDKAAALIGAVNAVVVKNDGELEGRNTDAYGFAQSLLASGFKRHGAATVLGAGGGARAVVAALRDLGFSEIRIVNRTLERAEALAAQLKIDARIFAWNNYREAFPDAGLLVNATSLGMQGQPPLGIALEELPQDATVTDLVYAPLATGLLAEAQKRGHKAVDGLGMLLHQARPAFKAFFGRDPEVSDELRRYVLGGG